MSAGSCSDANVPIRPSLADDAAHGVVGEPLLDRGAERVGHEVAPDPGVHLVADVALDRQRLEQRRGHDVRQVGEVCVELAPGVVVGPPGLRGVRRSSGGAASVDVAGRDRTTRRERRKSSETTASE